MRTNRLKSRSGKRPRIKLNSRDLPTLVMLLIIGTLYAYRIVASLCHPPPKSLLYRLANSIARNGRLTVLS